MKTILIPIFDQRISSRLDCTECFKVIKIENNSIYSTDKIKIIAKNQLEKLNIILSLKPDTIICNGLTEFYKTELAKNNINVVPWIHGNYNDVVESFVNGNLSHSEGVV